MISKQIYSKYCWLFIYFFHHFNDKYQTISTNFLRLTLFDFIKMRAFVGIMELNSNENIKKKSIEISRKLNNKISFDVIVWVHFDWYLKSNNNDTNQKKKKKYKFYFINWEIFSLISRPVHFEQWTIKLFRAEIIEKSNWCNWSIVKMNNKLFKRQDWTLNRTERDGERNTTRIKISNSIWKNIHFSSSLKAIKRELYFTPNSNQNPNSSDERQMQLNYMFLFVPLHPVYLLSTISSYFFSIFLLLFVICFGMELSLSNK